MPAITSVSSNPSWVQQRTNEPCLSECFLNTACGEISNHSRRGQVPKGRSAWARPKPTGVSVMSYKKSYPGLYAPPLDRGKVSLWGQGEPFKEDRVMDDDSPRKLKQEA